MRALASHQCGLGFDSLTQRFMWVEFVVGSRPCSERFSRGSLVFPSPQTPTFPNNFQFDLESEGHRFVSCNRLSSVTLVKQS